MLAITRPEAAARVLVRPVNWFRIASAPFTLALNKVSNAILRLFGVRPADIEEKHSSEDLKEMIRGSASGGTLDPGEAVMLGGVFHLHEQEAREVMTPIPAVVTVNADETVGEALQRCVSSGHTRLVVIEDDNPDKVRGIVHNNSLARIYMNAGDDAPLEPAIRDVPIFPETKPLDDLLAELQRQRSSIGVVSDEYGRTVGIVTIEDVLEEVVGEIEDETDPRATSLRRLADGDWYVRGHVPHRRPQGRRDRAAGLLRRLQLRRRLRLLRARTAAEARRRAPRRRLRDPGRVGAREPHRRAADPPDDRGDARRSHPSRPRRPPKHPTD